MSDPYANLDKYYKLRAQAEKAKKKENDKPKNNKKNDDKGLKKTILYKDHIGKKVEVTLINGEKIQGTLVDFSQYEIAVEGPITPGGKVIIMKHAILYVVPY